MFVECDKCSCIYASCLHPQSTAQVSIDILVCKYACVYSIHHDHAIKDHAGDIDRQLHNIYYYIQLLDK